MPRRGAVLVFFAAFLRLAFLLRSFWRGLFGCPWLFRCGARLFGFLFVAFRYPLLARFFGYGLGWRQFLCIFSDVVDLQ